MICLKLLNEQISSFFEQDDNGAFLNLEISRAGFFQTVPGGQCHGRDGTD
jgi:hypothetical protein